MIFLAVEGVSGSGKSTFSTYLKRALEDSGVKVFHLAGMETQQSVNPINDFIKEKFLSKDRFIRLPFWAETFLLLANMSFNSHAVTHSGSDVVIRENHLAALQAFQTARAKESSIEITASIRRKLQMLGAISSESNAAAVYWIRANPDSIGARLRIRPYDKDLLYSEKEQLLQKAIANEYERMLSHRNDVLEIQNDEQEGKLERIAGQEAKRWRKILMTRKVRTPLIYVAGPLYSPGERAYIETLDTTLTSHGYSTFIPHRDAGVATMADSGRTHAYFDADCRAIIESDAVVAILNGADVDSGTAWEMAYAYALGKPVFGMYEDSRLEDVNLMLLNSTRVCRSVPDLLTALQEILHEQP